MILHLRSRNQSRTLDRLPWLAAAGICAWNLLLPIAVAQNVHPRFLLNTAQIISAMEGRQLPTQGVQVRLAAPITSVSASPQLEIQSVALLNPHEMRLRMNCRDRSECLAFFAFATYPEAINPARISVKLDQKPAGADASLPAAKPVAAAPAKSNAPAGDPIIRSGAPATLDFDGDRLHVRIEVICLEAGIAGDKIRVTTRDHKQVYVAEILTPTLLKGTF